MLALKVYSNCAAALEYIFKVSTLEIYLANFVLSYLVAIEISYDAGLLYDFV